ncbi:hypothetical protein HMH01_13870 [Halovulum dunhuangense]|uniref:DUF4350 domain-containing protein n=1 Tax=Halovulum dunhuangense TaxID=1505036 RepID=A0A849L5I9_9RHOB|nr:hypothetical protein [Halovulum dunhuangense]NNU81523.1 hypothetical protein [Halovulum dunhuangense]
MRLRLGPAELAMALAVVVVAAVGAFYLSMARELPLERSAMGQRGLIGWLNASGVEARYAGLETVTAGEGAFRILPVLDTDLDRIFARPRDDAAYLETGTERDLDADLIRRKAELLPTLVIAAKWQRAARLSGHADPEFLLALSETRAAFAPFGLDAVQLHRPETRVLEFEVPAGPATPTRRGLLYAPQLFAALPDPECTPLVTVPGGYLAISCTGADWPRPVHFLSDPDLMNNHGLGLAENADLSADLIGLLAKGAPVLIDTTDFIFATPQGVPTPARRWSELLAVLAWPNTLAWAALGLLCVLLFWRSWVRFGPAQALYDDRMSAARDASITAKARLLRLADNDSQLMQAHLHNRLRRIERELFGRALGGDPLGRIVAHLRRSDPALASGFAQAAAAVTTAGQGMDTARLMTVLDNFERQAERVVHGSR